MKKIILKFSTIIFLLFIGLGTVSAASFNVSVGTKSLSKGNKTKLTIKGSDVTGRFNIKSSNSGVVSISEDRAWIENDSYQITLTGLSVGTSTITITPVNPSDGSGNKVTLASKTIKITVSLPREKSTDNTLSSLSVDGYTITPEFNKDTLDYKIDVPEGTKTVKVNAKANSKYATLNGNGEKEVIPGVNNLTIVVKSESGSERIYNLVVNVIDQNPINVSVDGKDYTVIKLRENYKCPTHFTESETVIESNTIPTCTNDLIDYILVGLKDSEGNIGSFIYKNNEYIKYNELTSSNIKIITEEYAGEIENLEKTKLSIDDVTYDAFKFSNKSKYYVIYGVNIETGKKGLYVYDEENKTFSGYDTEYIDYLLKKNQTYIYVIVAFGAGLFLSIICIFILSKNKKKIKKTKNISEPLKEVKNEEQLDNNDIIEKLNEDVEKEKKEVNLFKTNKKNSKK